MCAAYWRMRMFGIWAPEGALCFITLSKPPTWKVKYTITRTRPLWRSATGSTSSSMLTTISTIFNRNPARISDDNVRRDGSPGHPLYVHPLQNLKLSMRRLEKKLRKALRKDVQSDNLYSDASEMTWMTGNLLYCNDSLEFPCTHSESVSNTGNVS